MRMVMRVMIAAHGRVVSKRAVQQRTHGFVRAARDTAVKADAGLRKRRLRARFANAGQIPENANELEWLYLPLENDVEIINNISFESTAGAFAADVGDFTVEFEPTATSLEQEGVGYVAASLGTECGFVPYTVYMASSEYMEENPDIIQKFTNAVYRGQLWTENHTSGEIAEVIQSYFPENDVETLAGIIERYKSQDTWRATPVYSEEDFELFEDIMEEGGELTRRVAFDELIDNSFAQKAVETVKAE